VVEGGLGHLSYKLGGEALCQPFRPVKGHGNLASVGDAVQRVSGAVHHGAWAHLRDLAVALNFAGTFADDEKFFFRMAMRRMGARTGIEDARTGRNTAELIGRAVEIDEGLLTFEDNGRGGGHVKNAFGKLFSGEFGGDCAVYLSHKFNI